MTQNLALSVQLQESTSPVSPHRNSLGSECLSLRVQLCLTVCNPLTVARQVPLSMEFSRQDYSKRVAISSSRGPSPPRDRICISCVCCVGRWILYYCTAWEAQAVSTREQFQGFLFYFLSQRSLPFFKQIHGLPRQCNSKQMCV